MVIRVSLAMCVSLIVVAISPAASAQPTLGESLVAMVRVSEKDVIERGAALVVHQSADRTVLVTAYHVLREQDGRWKGKPSVEFLGRRGTLYPANVSSEYADKALDLAVLFVDHVPGMTPPSLKEGLQQAVVTPSEEASLLGAEVRITGFIGERPWRRTAAADRIVSSDSLRIGIRSTDAQGGASGGAIVDSLGRWVAMGSKIENTATGPILYGVAMAAIGRRFATWGLPFDLRKTDAPSAGGAIAGRLRDEMRLEVTFAPQSDADYTTLYWRHQYRARLPSDIASSVAQVVVEHTANLLPESVVLRPPDFSIHATINNATRLTFKVVVVLHDGRRFGPYETPVDLSAGPREVAQAKGPEALRQFENTLRTMQGNVDRQATHRANYEATMRATREQSLQQQVEFTTKQLKQTYLRWRVRCHRIVEPTVDAWECTGPGSPIGGHWSRDLPAGRVFEEVRIGGHMDRTLVVVPLAEESFGMKFLDQVAKLLKEGAEEVYVTTRLIDGTVLGPKQLCILSSAAHASRARPATEAVRDSLAKLSRFCV